jgi:hypothetical protein
MQQGEHEGCTVLHTTAARPATRLQRLQLPSSFRGASRPSVTLFLEMTPDYYSLSKKGSKDLQAARPPPHIPKSYSELFS